MATNKMRHARRSGCPINLTIEILGDRWSRIVIRDLMFGNHRHFNDLLRLSQEGITSNLPANRRTRLVETGLPVSLHGIHIDAPVQRPSVFAELQTGFENAMSPRTRVP